MRNLNGPEDLIVHGSNLRGRLMQILALSAITLGGCATTGDQMETMQTLVEKLGGEYPGLPQNGAIIDCAEGATESAARQEAENTNKTLLGQNAKPENFESVERDDGWIVCVKSGTPEDTSTSQATDTTETSTALPTIAIAERPVSSKKNNLKTDSDDNHKTGEQPSQESEINRLIKENKSYFRSCYEKVLKNDSEAGGKIRVKVQIRPDGSVEKVTLYNISSIGQFMAMCVKNNISGWKLPPSNEGSVIKFPLLFTSSGSDK